jgi:hypothetical protein
MRVTTTAWHTISCPEVGVSSLSPSSSFWEEMMGRERTISPSTVSPGMYRGRDRLKRISGVNIVARSSLEERPGSHKA